MSNDKLSPADICIKRADTWLTYSEAQTIALAYGHRQLNIEFEHRAWVCCFCGEAQEYYMLNGQVIRGCGSHDRYENGRHSQGCDKPACIEAADKFHAEGSR